MLVLKAFPTKSLLESILGILFDIRHQVKWLDHFHTQYALVQHLVDQDVGQWETFELACPEASMNVIEQCLVNAWIAAPFLGFTATFSRIVRAGQDVLDPILTRELVQAREKGCILGQVLIGNLRTQESHLQVLHLLPVDHFCV
ncbi:hypothetical protein D3C84_907460 [compost metagenome]